MSALLAKIASLALTTWNYKAQAESIRHLGPTAQDFHAASASEKMTSTLP